jgi:NADPH-dependent 2,4-dienoyl-CoA reductase/sulfur reductase-like enzyme/nitrite reductase/ring-hydroxylating ferredoxin subunit
MGGEHVELSGPDLRKGIPLSEIADGEMLLGHAGGEPVLLARRGDEVFAVGAMCTHYGVPLAEGILVGDTVRCPAHHACFSLRTGEAIGPPALNPVASWVVERRGEMLYVTGRSDAVGGREPRTAEAADARSAPESIVILGAGAAGNAAAEMLRREGYTGRLTLIGAEESVPYDRPNLSKDYLAGSAPEEWIPLRSAEFYAERGIELVLGTPASEIDVEEKQVVLADGGVHPFDRLLLATGAEPVRLDIPGADLPHVYYLRSLADSRAIIARAEESRQAVVLGASFIGLEAAASLRARGLEVHVVAPDARPLERVLGPDVGDFIRALHEEHGVVFHLQQTAHLIQPSFVVLGSGDSLPADLVVVGIGVRPATGLAGHAGLAMEGGVLVDEYLETSVPGIYAAGDIARYPDPRSGERVRIEHRVVAERQGRTAARNMLGRRERFDAVPFFWSNHYDVGISYVGHATHWDGIEVSGSIQEGNCALAFRADGKTLAVATMGRGRAQLVRRALKGPGPQHWRELLPGWNQVAGIVGEGAEDQVHERHPQRPLDVFVDRTDPLVRLVRHHLRPPGREFHSPGDPVIGFHAPLPRTSRTRSLIASATTPGWSSGVKCLPPGMRRSSVPRSVAKNSPKRTFWKKSDSPHTTRVGILSPGRSSRTASVSCTFSERTCRMKASAGSCAA